MLRALDLDRGLLSKLALVFLVGCATPPKLSEIVALEKLRTDPTLSDPDRRAFDLLAASDALLVRSSGEWEHRKIQAAREDALMGQIKMKTAVAILQAEQAAGRVAELDAALAVARDEAGRLDDQLATAQEEVDLLERLRATKASAAKERATLSAQADVAKKKAETERQRFSEQLAAAKRRADALDGLRRAELAVKTADTVDAGLLAKAKYGAAVAMLQEAHKEFDAGHWDETLARTTLAESEAQAGITLARPQYEKAAQVLSNRARDRALEMDATALPGVAIRLSRDGDLQRLVLIFHGLFADKSSTMLPDGAKALDQVKELLAKYPTYPLQLTGFTDDQGKPDALVAISLARSNAVYWALVARGIDPKRISVDGKGPANAIADNSTPSGRAENSRVELSILYHSAE